jgi:hypothetical protein
MTQKKTVMVNQANWTSASLGFIVNSWFDPTSLVLLVDKTEENNRPVRKSLTNYREVYQVHLDKEKDWRDMSMWGLLFQGASK